MLPSPPSRSLTGLNVHVSWGVCWTLFVVTLLEMALLVCSMWSTMEYETCECAKWRTLMIVFWSCFVSVPIFTFFLFRVQWK